MHPTFSVPVLSITPSALKQLDGEDALPGLWTLFTRCQGSLEDGPRLENISWRLWHREISPLPYRRPRPISRHVPKPSHRPVTPNSDHDRPRSHRPKADGYPFPPATEHAGNPDKDAAASDVSTSPDSLDSPLSDGLPSPAVARASSPCPVGKLIYDILPTKITYPLRKPTLLSVPPNPTPATALPKVVLPSQSSTPASSAPRVVVVNPTPHPTPPATPLIAAATPSLAHDTPSALAPLHLSPQGSAMSLSPERVPAGGGAAAATAPRAAPQKTDDDTLKPSDRRFFLQQSPEDDSPERLDTPPEIPPSPTDTGHSVTSASVKTGSSAASTGIVRGRGTNPAPDGTTSRAASANRKAPSKLKCFKGSKEAMRHGQGKALNYRKATAGAAHQRPGLARRATSEAVPGIKTKSGTVTATAAAVTVGSTSSNGSKAAGPVPKKQQDQQRASATQPPTHARSNSGNAAPVAAKPALGPSKNKRTSYHGPITTAEKAAPVAGPKRRGIVMDASSTDFETESDDDSGSWASEDISPEPTTQAAAVANGKGPAAGAAKRSEKAKAPAKEPESLFEKLPKRSYSNLNRTGSGLLTMLLNPNPAIFPEGHPHRSRFSSEDVAAFGRRQEALQRRGLAMTAAPPPPTLSREQPRQPPETRAPQPRPVAPPALQTSKSAVVLPTASLTKAVAAAPTVAQNNGVANGTAGAYRPKGRPQGADMEDESESEAESGDNSLHLSKSLAHQKLAALADAQQQRRAAPAQPAPQTSAAPARRPQAPSLAQTRLQQLPTHPPRPQPTSQRSAPTPIPLGHPYNLPMAAPPTTPRTTRRTMLSSEMSESMRRQLLWERQVSRWPQRRRTSNPDGSKQEEDEEARRRAQQRSMEGDFHTSGW